MNILYVFQLKICLKIKNMESFDSSEEDLVSNVIKKYQNYSSIKLIKTKNKSKTFRFRETITDEIKKFIEKSNPKKASQKSDMSTNIFKKIQLSSLSTSLMISML